MTSARTMGYSNYFTDPTVSAQIFEADSQRAEEELVKELLSEFTEEERSSFQKTRKRGTQTAEDIALYKLRRIAVERYFMRHSVSAPQTKRHMYYKCKGLFCGVDTPVKKFSVTIATIIGRTTAVTHEAPALFVASRILLAENDIDSAAIDPTDDPIVPADVEDPPVAKLLERKRDHAKKNK